MIPRCVCNIIQYLFIISIVYQIYWTVVLHNAVLLTAKTFIPLRVQFIHALHLTSSASHLKRPAIEIYYPFACIYLTLFLLLKCICCQCRLTLHYFRRIPLFLFYFKLHTLVPLCHSYAYVHARTRAHTSLLSLISLRKIEICLRYLLVCL